MWGNAVAYLQSVKTEGEQLKNDYFTTLSITCQDFVGKIKAEFPNADFSADNNEWIGDIVKTKANYVKTINIGGVDIDGAKIRSMFNLISTYFDVKTDGEKIVFTVAGYGHGVGMSQYGANYMAKRGVNYKAILEKYYQGAQVIK